MPPKMDRAEAAFDAVRGALDEGKVKNWKPQEMEVFVSLVERYYVELKSRSILEQRKRRNVARRSSAENGKHVEEDEDEEEEVDEEEADAMQREAAIAEVDRSLASVRAFLQRRAPFGLLPEPSHVPYTNGTSNTTSTAAEVGKTNGGRAAKAARMELPLARSSAGAVQPVTYSIDAFLYLDEDIDELTDSGAVSRHYCTDCGSVRLAPTDFVTHSFSQDQLVYLSCFLLPALAEEAPAMCARRVVDVGSRYGVVLWACYFAAQQALLTKTESVCGVELDKQFVEMQQAVGKRLCSQPVPLDLDEELEEGEREKHKNISESHKALTRGDINSKQFEWCVVESDCFVGAGAEQLASADVVILHNVFEYFCKSEREHMECWLKLKALVKRPGQVLVCSPSIEEALLGFSEETLVACGVMDAVSSAEGSTGKTGQKRGRADNESTADKKKINNKGKKNVNAGESDEEDEDEDEEEFDNTPDPKELAVARWVDAFLEPVDEEVEELADEFIAFRKAQQEHDGHGEEDGSNDDDDDEEEEEGHGHSHSHGHGHCHDHGHSHSHGNGHCAHGGDADENDDDSDAEEKEPSEMEEQIRNIWVYRVK